VEQLNVNTGSLCNKVLDGTMDWPKGHGLGKDLAEAFPFVDDRSMEAVDFNITADDFLPSMT